MQPVDDVLKLHYFSESYVISSPGDENETKHLEALEGAEKCLRLFQIDLLDYPSILAAINGCAGVFHLTSPCIVDEVREPEIDQKVQREIINHRSLRHPNIVRFKEVLLTPTHLAIVMEYAAGGELFEKICNAGRFSEDEARFFFQQLISGVSYCHSMQICHRDLKLENTLLDENTTFAELTGNDIFKGDVPPSSAEKAISTAKMREMSGSNIFADGKADPRDYLGGVRQPPGGDSSIFLV